MTLKDSSRRDERTSALRYDGERKPISEIIQPTNYPGLDIVPANLELQEYEYETPLAASNKNSPEGRLFFTRITTALREVDDRYDVVVIDCPPQLGYLTLTALTACPDQRSSADARHHVDVSVPADARGDLAVDQDCRGGRQA